MNVLSLFNGMSTLQTALENTGIKINKYYSSEIKPYAIKFVQEKYPDTIQLGDVTKWEEWDIDWSEIDFIGSGSPCQDLSIAGKRKGLKGERSSLFYTFVDILNHVKSLNPNVLFLQENVGSAPSDDVRLMSEALGVLPIRINSNLLTAQNRDRYYWTNIKTREDWAGYVWVDIPQPKDRNVFLKDIIESGYIDKKKSNSLLERTAHSSGYKDMMSDKAQKYLLDRYNGGFITCVKETFIIKEATEKGYCEVKPGDAVDLAYPKSKTRRGRLMEEKSNALLRKNEFYVNNGYYLRLFTQTELERLQGFPDEWTSLLSYNHASSLLGDGWTLPVIEYILSFIKKIKMN